MSRTLLVVCASVLLADCKKPTVAPPRMEVRQLGGNVVQFVPGADQLPFCLIYTQSEKGVTRQMTMTQSNQSVACPAGEPVLGLRFRLPADEGRVKVRVLFSDQRLQATELAAQVVEMSSPTFDPINLRLPGRVVLESLDVVPAQEPLAVAGEIVSSAKSDAGSFSAPR